MKKKKSKFGTPTTSETTKSEEKKVESTPEVKEENNKENNVKNDDTSKEKTPDVKEEAKKEPQESKTEPTKVENKETSNKTEKTTTTSNEPKKKKKHTGLIVSIVLIILAIIIGAISAVVYCFVFATTEIDLAKYISFDVEGYEGYVNVTEENIHIDEKALKKEIDDSSVSKKLISKLEDAITVEENEKLKNGDEVTIKVKLKESFLKDNKLKLKSDEIAIKIEGLEETESVDVFKDLEFNVSGVSPDLSLTLSNKSSDSFIKSVNYTMEDSDGNSNTYRLSGLKIGDKITITASYSETSLQISGYTVENDTYEYTIESAPEYITKEDAFTEAVKKSLTENFENKIKSNSTSNAYRAVSNITEDEINYSDEFTASAPSLEKLYLLTAKKDSNYTHNKVYGIYKVTFTSKTNNKTYDYYYTIYTSNVITEKKELYKGSTLSYYTSSEYGSSSYAKNTDDAYKYFIDSQSSDFDIKEIK